MSGTREDAAAAPALSSIESLFRGGTLDLSPGPMTLLSSFFADDPDAEYRSFSQLLAGTMEESSRLEHHRRPPGMTSGHQESSLFTVPPGISPTLLLDSRGFFSSGTLQFGMSDRQDLHSNSDFRVTQAAYPSLSTSQPSTSAINMAPIQQRGNVVAENLFSDQRSQQPVLVVDKPADDGYNWRKYGQKQVKGSEYPRSYYKCTHPNCPVKKKVERSMDGQITEIIYKGQHNHQRPPANRRVKEGGGVHDLNDNSDHQNDIAGVPASKRDRECGIGMSDQLSGLSDDDEEDDTEGKADEGADSEPNAKRMNVDMKVESSSTQRTVTEPRIIVQTTSEVDLLDDGYRWRKYGQKVVKGNLHHPRSYYKCTHTGCNVRKHVERASSDPKAVITTYEGKHNHDVPAARNSSHITNTVNSNVLQPKAQRMAATNLAFLNRPGFSGSNQRSVAVLQMKQEHEIT